MGPLRSGSSGAQCLETVADMGQDTWLVFLCVALAVTSGTTPVSVHLGDNATFSWPLPASARGKLVLVVGPTGARVLSWAPDCTVTPFSDFADRVRSSCKDTSQVTFTLLWVRWTDEGSYTCEAVSFWSPRIEDCGQELTVFKAQASHGYDWWQRTIAVVAVLSVIVPTIPMCVVICYIRCYGWTFSKNSSKDRMNTKPQEIYLERPVTPSPKQTRQLEKNSQWKQSDGTYTMTLKER